MTSAVEMAKSKLGVVSQSDNAEPTTAKVVPLSAAVEGRDDKIRIDGDLLADVEAEAKAGSDQDRENNALAAMARLQSEVALDQYGEFNCLAMVGSRREVVNIDSAAGGDYIFGVFSAITGKYPPKSQIDNIRAILRNDARNRSARMTVHQRIAALDGARIIDLGDAAGNCVVIRNGAWDIVPNEAVALIRGRGYGALPIPVQPSDAQQAVFRLAKWLAKLGVPTSRVTLVLVTLVAWLRTGNAYPLLLLYGAAGSGKSMAARLITLLIDPTDSMTMPNISMDTEHIAAAAQHRHLLTFDNVSKLSAAIEDTLCTCATGGEIIDRKLYSNGDIAVLPIHRPVLMTAVQPVITRTDLMSRAIPIEITAPATRLGEDEILSKFLEQRPKLLGALCELLAAAGD